MMLVNIVFVFGMAVSVHGAGNTNVLKSSNEVFSSNFYKVESIEEKHRGKNLLICPLSLNYALTVLSLGAGGNTLKELRTILNQPDDQNAIISSFTKFTEDLKDNRNLTIASKVYVDNKFVLKQQFINDLKNFDSGIENVDFSGNTEQSRKVINNYVDNKTNHLIPELLERSSVSQSTTSVIVNAVHFKSQWEIPFKKDGTYKSPFYGLDKDYEVDMMRRSEMPTRYRNDSDLNAQILELPYLGGFSFIVILPNEKKGITELENKLRSTAANGNSFSFIEIPDTTEVEVFLPKFKFEQTFHLRETLTKMGIKEIFASTANFTGLTDKSMAITDAIQKTYIDVNEANTEAAAATALISSVTGTKKTHYPLEFTADHPFLYIIKHGATSSPLFIGRFNKP